MGDCATGEALIVAQIRIDWDWFHCHAADVGGDAFLVLSALVSYMHTGDDYCWPSRETLVNVCGLSEDRIKRAIGRLCRQGWLVAERRKFRSSRYRIHPWVRCTPQAERYAWDTHSRGLMVKTGGES
jgi:hypothetical protein